ncbi:MAG: toxin-antitoxin system YwqK family antitoxin [Sphingobacteriales bacterium]
MKHLILFVCIFTTALSFGQIKEHECPDNAKFKKQEIGDETICMCVTGELLNGPTFIYSKKGEKKEENNWALGVKSGKWRKWDNKGTLIYEANYSNGELDGVETFYFDNGKPKVLTTYSNGIKNGRIAEWFENRKQNTEGYFTNNVQDKIWIFRMKDNKTVSVARYKDGIEQTYKFVIWTKDEFSVPELEKTLE